MRGPTRKSPTRISTGRCGSVRAPKRKYSAERYFRWRKFWDYSTGNAGDLLYHRLGMMSTMVGFDFPTRASAWAACMCRRTAKCRIRT